MLVSILIIKSCKWVKIREIPEWDANKKKRDKLINVIIAVLLKKSSEIAAVEDRIIWQKIQRRDVKDNKNEWGLHKITFKHAQRTE